MGVTMGRREIEALLRILEAQLAGENLALGTWAIHFDKAREAFVFDKCEFGDYCQERPSVIAVDGAVLDRGGPILGAG